MKRLIAILLILSLPSMSFAGALKLPPDLTRVPGFTVIISSPTAPGTDVIDQLISYGVSAENVVWLDTSGIGSASVTAVGNYGTATAGTLVVTDGSGNKQISLSGYYGTVTNGSITVGSGALSQSIKGRWNLANRTYTDLSGNGNTLSENSSVFTTDTGHGSGSSLSTHFDRNPGYPYLSRADNASFDITGNLTISAWVKYDVVNTYQMLVSKWANSDQSYVLWTDQGQIKCSLSGNGSTQTDAKTAVSTVTTATWYHVGCVYNGTDIRIYINGSLASNGADNPKTYSSGIFNSAASFIIGTYQYVTTYSLEGSMDDVAIWARALSSTEISTLYGLGDDFSGGDW